MTDKKQPELKEEVVSIADKLRESATYNKEKGLIEFDKDVFEKTLPEGMTAKAVRKMQQHQQNLAIAQAIVAGEMGINEMKKDKGLDKVESVISLPIGNSKTVTLRQSEVRNLVDGSVRTEYGRTSARITTKIPAGQVAAMRNRLAEAAKKAGLDK